jgi:hypothetical protein
MDLKFNESGSPLRKHPGQGEASRAKVLPPERRIFVVSHGYAAAFLVIHLGGGLSGAFSKGGNFGMNVAPEGYGWNKTTYSICSIVPGARKKRGTTGLNPPV